MRHPDERLCQSRCLQIAIGPEPIADSTRIIGALEEPFPVPALYPQDAVARQRALALEDDLDETPSVRAAIMSPLFREDPDIALRVLTTGVPDEGVSPTPA